MTRHRSMIESHPLGATAAGHLLVEHSQRQAASGHHPLKLAIAIQFWKGDKRAALRLARFLADVEPSRREDVMLILASRYDLKMDNEIAKTMMYCGRKFYVSHVRSLREAKGHPAGCFGLWAGTADRCYANYSAKGWPWHNVFFVEAEGVPARWDWIDHLKRLHAANLATGKRVTGAIMEASQFYDRHVNGTLAMHMSCWADHPSLHVCPDTEAWDCFHSQVLVSEAGHHPAVANLYGAHKLSLSTYKTLGRDFAWIASVKDGSAWKCAQSLVGREWKRLLLSAWPNALKKPKAPKVARKGKRSK